MYTQTMALGKQMFFDNDDIPRRCAIVLFPLFGLEVIWGIFLTLWKLWHQGRMTVLDEYDKLSMCWYLDLKNQASSDYMYINE